MARRPAFQFYPADWRNDNSLSLCSLSARGLWIELICLMHTADVYGHLRSAGRALDAKDVARLVGADEREVAKCLGELERNEVLSRTPDGTIFSRRMVRDEDLRNRRAEGGQAGASYGHLGAEYGRKGGRPRAERGDQKPPSKPSPSSSSSSSSTSVADATEAGASHGSTVADPIWGAGLAWLVRKGIPEKEARPLLGKVKQALGDAETARALRQAEIDDITDPKSWLMAVSKRRPGQLPRDTRSDVEIEAANDRELARHGMGGIQ